MMRHVADACGWYICSDKPEVMGADWERIGGGSGGDRERARCGRGADLERIWVRKRVRSVCRADAERIQSGGGAGAGG